MVMYAKMSKVQVFRLMEPNKEKDPLGYLGIAHIDVHIGNKRTNLDRSKYMILFSSFNEVRTLILPYMQPYGPVIDEIALEKKTELRKKYALSINSAHIQQLSLIAKNHGVNVVIPGIIEKAGSKLYVSGIFISGEIGVPIERYRKIILKEREDLLGISKGREPKIFTAWRLRFSIMIDNEIFYPELARLNTLLGSNIIVYGMSSSDPIKNYKLILRTIAQTMKTWIIMPGVKVYEQHKLCYSLPTLVIDPEGEVLFKYNDNDQALILLPVRKLIKRREIDEETRLIVNWYIKYFMKKRKR